MATVPNLEITKVNEITDWKKNESDSMNESENMNESGNMNESENMNETESMNKREREREVLMSSYTF